MFVHCVCGFVHWDVAQIEADTKAPLLDLLCQNQNQLYWPSVFVQTRNLTPLSVSLHTGLTKMFTQTHMDMQHSEKTHYNELNEGNKHLLNGQLKAIKQVQIDIYAHK